MPHTTGPRRIVRECVDAFARPSPYKPPSFSDRRGRARGHFRRVTSARWMCLLPLDPVCGTSSMWQACALIQIYVESVRAAAARGTTPPRLGIHARGACSTIRPIVAALAVL